MVGFAKIPQMRGDTDDDASIHLHSRVGPAKPISHHNYDRQIQDILNGTNADDADDLDVHNYNLGFKLFTDSGSYEEDSEDELTQVEDQEYDRAPAKSTPKQGHRLKSSSKVIGSGSLARKPVNALPKNLFQDANPRAQTSQASLSMFFLKMLGFFLGMAVLFLIPSQYLTSRELEPQIDLSGVNAKLEEVSQRVGVLNEISSALDQQVDVLQTKQESFTKSIYLKIASMEASLQALQKDPIDSARLLKIEAELQDCKTKIDSTHRIVAEKPEEIEKKISQISLNLAQLQRLNNDMLAIKSDIVDSLLEKLPGLVPVYVKDNKIHYLPEFHDFLVSFVNNMGNKSNETSSWKQFIELNGSQFKAYINDLVDTSGVKFLTKAQFEESLHERLNLNNRALVAKVNSILDKMDLLRNSTNIDLSVAGNRIVLDNLLEVVGKGSVKVNFADYKLGSRILGFLTTIGSDIHKNRSLVGSFFLGWYDLLTSSGLRSALNMKYNANNVLVDGGEFWQCGSHKCTVGIRLSSPIIITDLILNNPSSAKPPGLHMPDSISIYVKPRKRSDAKKLEQYLEYRLPFAYRLSENKYLSKFYKIHEATFRSSRAIEHIKLPVSIINMRIPVRDVYVEISSRQGPTGLYNLKAYGLTELNTFRYAENFESILDQLDESRKDTDRPEYFEVQDSLLGDDYIL